MCGIVWCYYGARSSMRIREILEPLRKSGCAGFREPRLMPFPMLQGMFDGLYPPGLQWYWKADFVNELSDQAVGAASCKHTGRRTSHAALHHAPVPHQRRGAQAGRTLTRPGIIATRTWTEVIVGGRLPNQPTKTTSPHGQKILGKRCIPMAPAAPMSIS